MTPMRPTHPSQKIGSGDAPPDPLAPLAPLDPSPVPQWSAEAIERMRARLIRNEQLAALGRVVAALAHEINNPLSGLLGSIGIMQEIVGAVGAPPAAVPDADREELRGLLLDCGTMVDRIRELMNAVRGMSRDCDTEDVAFDPVRAIRDAARAPRMSLSIRCARSGTPRACLPSPVDTAATSIWRCRRCRRSKARPAGWDR